MAGPGQDAPPNQYRSPPMQAQEPPAQQPPAQQQAAPQAPSAVSTFVSSLSQAELFALGGGALILVTDLVFARLGPYGFSDVIWAAAAAAVVLVLLRDRLAAVVPYPGTLIILGGASALVLVREIVRDVIILGGRVTGIDPMFILGMVGLYAGVALMAYGAYTLYRSRTA